MENDDEKKLNVWASDAERRDVYLTAKKTSPSWKKVIMRKTVDVEKISMTRSYRSSTLGTRTGAA